MFNSRVDVPEFGWFPDVTNHVCRPSTNGQGIFSPGSFTLVSGVMVCFGLWVFVTLQFTTPRTGVIPAPAGESECLLSSPGFAGVTVLCCVSVNLAWMLWRPSESPYPQQDADWLFPNAFFPQVNRTIEHLSYTMAHSRMNFCTIKRLGAKTYNILLKFIRKRSDKQEIWTLDHLHKNPFCESSRS